MKPCWDSNLFSIDSTEDCDNFSDNDFDEDGTADNPSSSSSPASAAKTSGQSDNTTHVSISDYKLDMRISSKKLVCAESLIRSICEKLICRLIVFVDYWSPSGLWVTFNKSKDRAVCRVV